MHKTLIQALKLNAESVEQNKFKPVSFAYIYTAQKIVRRAHGSFVCGGTSFAVIAKSEEEAYLAAQEKWKFFILVSENSKVSWELSKLVNVFPVV